MPFPTMVELFMELLCRRVETSQQCPICLEPETGDTIKVVVRGCRHIFHYDCFKLWLEADTDVRTCPVCRGRLPGFEAPSNKRTFRYSFEAFFNYEVSRHARRRDPTESLSSDMHLLETILLHREGFQITVDELKEWRNIVCNWVPSPPDAEVGLPALIYVERVKKNLTRAIEEAEGGVSLTHPRPLPLIDYWHPLLYILLGLSIIGWIQNW